MKSAALVLSFLVAVLGCCAVAASEEQPSHDVYVESVNLIPPEEPGNPATVNVKWGLVWHDVWPGTIEFRLGIEVWRGGVKIAEVIRPFKASWKADGSCHRNCVNECNEECWIWSETTGKKVWGDCQHNIEDPCPQVPSIDGSCSDCDAQEGDTSWFDLQAQDVIVAIVSPIDFSDLDPSNNAVSVTY